MTGTAYSLSFSDDVAASPAVVFELFTDLRRLHLWSAGLLPVTGAERMVAGLQYTAQSVTAGQLSRSQVTVAELVPNERVRLTNHSGVIGYDMLTVFTTLPHGHTRLTCQMSFTLSAGLLAAAQPVVEAMAEARIRGNWDTLKALLRDNTPAA